MRKLGNELPSPLILVLDLELELVALMQWKETS